MSYNSGMPKHSTVDVLYRWMLIDHALSCDGVRPEVIVAHWGVHKKTVKRDLDAFRALGQRIVFDKVKKRHCYKAGVLPLFTANHAELEAKRKAKRQKRSD
jgi:hypothetical protein